MSAVEEKACAHKLFHATKLLSAIPLQDLNRGLFLQGYQEAALLEGTKHKKLKKPSSSQPEHQLQLSWYSQFWTDLVVAIESECLLFHRGYNEQGNPGTLANRISISNPDTQRRCQVSCQYDHYQMRPILKESLPWAQEISMASSEDSHGLSQDTPPSNSNEEEEEISLAEE